MNPWPYPPDTNRLFRTSTTPGVKRAVDSRETAEADSNPFTWLEA